MLSSACLLIPLNLILHGATPTGYPSTAPAEWFSLPEAIRDNHPPAPYREVSAFAEHPSSREVTLTFVPFGNPPQLISLIKGAGPLYGSESCPREERHRFETEAGWFVRETYSVVKLPSTGPGPGEEARAFADLIVGFGVTGQARYLSVWLACATPMCLQFSDATELVVWDMTNNRIMPEPYEFQPGRHHIIATDGTPIRRPLTSSPGTGASSRPASNSGHEPPVPLELATAFHEYVQTHEVLLIPRATQPPLIWMRELCQFSDATAWHANTESRNVTTAGSPFSRYTERVQRRADTGNAVEERTYVDIVAKHDSTGGTNRFTIWLTCATPTALGFPSFKNVIVRDLGNDRVLTAPYELQAGYHHIEATSTNVSAP